MLSNLSIKNDRGFSKVAIIIIVVISILVIISGVVIFILFQNNTEKKPSTINTVQEAEVVWDTNNEITTEEKNKLKETYLGVFSLLKANNYQTEDTNLVEVAVQLVNNKRAKFAVQDDTDLNNQVTPMTKNSSQNVINDTTNTLIEEQSQINTNYSLQSNMGIETNTISNTTTLTNTTNTINTTSSSNTISNENDITTNTMFQTTANINQDEVERAINEIKGNEVANLSTILANRNTTNVITGYATEIVSMNKSEGVYDITYKACFPKQADLIKYGTIDKINTTAVDQMEKTIINIQLTKNRTSDYSEYKIKSIQEIGKEPAVSYYLSNENGKYGVIDQTGTTIIDNIYDFIWIPNNYRDIFICSSDLVNLTTTVLNKDKKVIYEDYANISLLQPVNQNGDSWWFEKDFLVYQSGGKYGAIDYDGYELLDPVYDKIEPLNILEGKIILTKNGKQTLADITGDNKKIHNFKYSKVGILGLQFSPENMVTETRSMEQVEQLMKTGTCIIGQDVVDSLEIIEIITDEERNVDFSTLPQINYPNKIGEWQYNYYQGYVIYTK